MESFTCTKALRRVWAGLKLVLTQSGARIQRMASDTPLMYGRVVLLVWVSSAIGTLAVGVDDFWMNLRG